MLDFPYPCLGYCRLLSLRWKYRCIRKNQGWRRTHPSTITGKTTIGLDLHRIPTSCHKFLVYSSYQDCHGRCYIRSGKNKHGTVQEGKQKWLTKDRFITVYIVSWSNVDSSGTSWVDWFGKLIFNLPSWHLNSKIQVTILFDGSIVTCILPLRCRLGELKISSPNRSTQEAPEESIFDQLTIYNWVSLSMI